jgi:hypothetical protein
MQLPVFLMLAALAIPEHPAMAASPKAPADSCLRPFLHADHHGKLLFHFKPRVQSPGIGLSEIGPGPPTGLLCSPGRRIIDAGEIGDANAFGADQITIMDAGLIRFVFFELVLEFNLSPDRRFIVFSPWGGPVGTSSMLAGDQLYLVDVDQPLGPNSHGILPIAGVFPTDADEYHAPASGKDDSTAQEKWDKWFAALPHPDEGIQWIAPRQFQFSLSDDNQGGAKEPWSIKHFTVTATIVLAGTEPPRIVLSIPKSPTCPRGVARVLAVIDAMAACSK